MRRRERGLVVLLLAYLSVTVLCLPLLLTAQPLEESAQPTADNQLLVDNQLEHENSRPMEGERFSLLAVTTFDHFKSMFHKHYSSFLEEMVRQKIFLGRAFQAFISKVKYTHFKASSYLGINQMSDETPEEREKLKLSAHVLGKEMHHHLYKSIDRKQKLDIPFAGIEDVEHEINEIEKHRNENGYREIAEEMEKDLTLDSFKLHEHSVSAKKHSESEFEDNSPMSVKEIRQITGLNSTNYLDNLVKSAVKGTSKSSSKQFANGRSKKDKLFVDHRESNCLNPVRNQALCGSCYAFSSIALYEFLYCKANGKRISFSEQYMIDCGYRNELYGCAGGFTTNAAEFINKFGLELRKDYPYRKENGTCPYEEDAVFTEMGYIKPQKTGFRELEDSNEIDEHLKERPILFSLSLVPNFRDYGGGVDDGKDCDDDSVHAMLLVGHGRENGKDYYLFRNSHGASWGEKGYYKFSKQAIVNCAPNDFGVVSDAEFLPNSSAENSEYTLMRSKLPEPKEKEKEKEKPIIPERPRTRASSKGQYL